jgi:ABC-type transport system substrate-binding protein
LARKVDEGAIDVVLDSPAPVEQIERYRSSPEKTKRAFEYPQDTEFYGSMNVAMPPFDDLAVRRALLFAIDRTTILRAAGGPLAVQLARHVAPDSLLDDLLIDYDPYATTGHAGDVERAKGEMRASRYDRDHDGMCDVAACRAVTFVVRQGEHEAEGREIVRAARAIGIDLRMKVVPDGEVYAESAPERRTPIAVGLRWAKDFPSAGNFFAPLFGSDGLEGGANFSLVGASVAQLSRWGYKTRTVPNLDDRLSACDPLIGRDQARCWAEFDTYVMEKIADWIPLVLVQSGRVVSERVAKFVWDQAAVAPALDHIAIVQGA